MLPMTKIEEIHKDDYQETAEFLARGWNKDHNFWLDRFEFLWDKNPAFPEDPHRGFVIKKDGNIAGFLGYFPTKFQLHGRETVASNGFGLIVAPELLGSGLGVKLKYKHAKLSKDKISFATTANQFSMKMNASLGYHLLPRGIHDYNLFSVVPINSFNTIKLFYYYYKLSRSLYALNKFCSNIKIIKNKISENNSLNKSLETKVVKIDQAGKEFDNLWENTKNLYDNTNIRNSEIIKWYLIPTKQANREIYASYIYNELTGFIVVKESKFRGIRFMLCLDLWFKKDNKENTIKSLIYFAKKQAVIKKCNAILLPNFSKYVSSIFDKFALFKLIGPKRNDLFLLQDKSVQISEQDSYFTYMHGDRFLV